MQSLGENEKVITCTITKKQIIDFLTLGDLKFLCNDLGEKLRADNYMRGCY